MSRGDVEGASGAKQPHSGTREESSLAWTRTWAAAGTPELQLWPSRCRSWWCGLCLRQRCRVTCQDSVHPRTDQPPAPDGQLARPPALRPRQPTPLEYDSGHSWWLQLGSGRQSQGLRSLGGLGTETSTQPKGVVQDNGWGWSLVPRLWGAEWVCRA